MNKTVFFVCVHNSGRSQMASAFFNRLAKGKVKAFSAGTQPAETVNPIVVEAMKEVGIDINNNKPQKFTMDLVEKADRMITMGCGADAESICPAGFLETEDWSLDDPHGKPIEEVRKIRDEVRRRVEKLLIELDIS
jgi:arsenate reductase (thioredoxin)